MSFDLQPPVIATSSIPHIHREADFPHRAGPIDVLLNNVPVGKAGTMRCGNQVAFTGWADMEPGDLSSRTGAIRGRSGNAIYKACSQPGIKLLRLIRPLSQPE